MAQVVRPGRLGAPGIVASLAAVYALLAAVVFVAGGPGGFVLAAQTVCLAALAGLARRRPDRRTEALLWVTAVAAGGGLVSLRLTGAPIYALAPAGAAFACAFWAEEQRRFLTVSALPVLTWFPAGYRLVETGALVASTFALCGAWLVSLALWRHNSQRREQAAATLEATRAARAAERFASRQDDALDSAGIGRWQWDLESDRFLVSAGWARMLGYEPGELTPTASEWLDRIHPNYAQQVKQSLHAHIYGGVEQFEADYRIRRRDGGYLWALTRGVAERDADGVVLSLSGCQIDVTDLVDVERRVLHDAYEDKLTGLPNRRAFSAILDRACDRAAQDPTRAFAVLFLDLNRFKVINDSLGHLVGDQLLAAVASRLRGVKRPGDSVARLGGDEFVLLLEGINRRDEAVSIAEEVREALAAPYRLGENEVTTGASIGVALSGSASLSPEDLLRNADTAMYRAKSERSGRIVVFTSEMHLEAMRQCELQNDLGRALERDELDLHFQPIIHLRTKDVCAVEALLRWRRHGVLMGATEFIGVAEELGLISDLGEWALRAACERRQSWLKSGLPDVSLSVNVSPRQLRAADFPRRVQHVLDATGTPPSRLQLELTESALVDCTEDAAKVLRELADMKITLAIDDFGAGHSSLSYLTNFPFKVLKLDRSFLADLHQDPRRQAVVKGLINLAHALELEVTAEGVESRETLSYLLAQRCDMAQGFFFSKPLSDERTAALLAALRQPTPLGRPVDRRFRHTRATDTAAAAAAG